MKNKILYFLFLIFIPTLALSNELELKASQIESYDKGNLIKGFDGITVIDGQDLIITAEEFEFDKIKSILQIFGNTIIEDKINKITIKTNQIIFYEKLNIIISKGDTAINLTNDHLLEGSNITFNRNLKEISSNDNALVTDIDKNQIKMSRFNFSILKKILKASLVKIIDSYKNDYEIENIQYNLNTKQVLGKDLIVNFNNEGLNTTAENEPRLKGNAVVYNDNITTINKGIFTTCKKNDNCPPWSMSAEVIKHDKIKKRISYKNAWLKIYNTPVVYFPKFFHPDPTVKRQSGFLAPQFSQSKNKGNYVSIPYFNAISDSSDLTFSPRLYDGGKSIYQTEYRNYKKNSKHLVDFSIKNENSLPFEKKSNSATHFFLKSEFDLNLINFDETKIDLQIQQTSQDNYLKKYHLKSPLITSLTGLHSKLNFMSTREDLEIQVGAEVYENLSLLKSDRYEYIYPSFNMIKNIKEFNSGNLSLKSNGYNKQFNTNINEKIFINDLTYNSNNNVSLNGLINNFEILLKNFNSKTKNSTTYKDSNESALQSIINYELKYPLQKTNEKYYNTFTPIMSLRYSPNKSKNKSEEDRIINYENVFSINRIGTQDTVEGGQSLTVGSEYAFFNNYSNEKLFSLNLATVLRDKENKKLPINSTIGQKNSDIFGSIDLNANKFIKLDYNFSLDNNLDRANYNQIKSTFTVNNFITTFDFLEKNTFDGGESYISNESKFDIDENMSLSFKTRKNKEKNLTEYYNWIYQYKNDCLIAGIEYKKDYYTDVSIKPDEQLFFSITVLPFGSVNSPYIK